MIDAHRRTESARRPNRCPCGRAKAVNHPTAKTALPSLPKSDCDEGKIGAHPLDDANGSDAPTPCTHGLRSRCAQRKKSCAAHTLGRRQLMPRSFAFAGSQPRWGRLCPARFNPCTDAAFHPRNRFVSPFRGSQAILPLPISRAISIPIHGSKYCDKCHNLTDCYLVVTTFWIVPFGNCAHRAILQAFGKVKGRGKGTGCVMTNWRRCGCPHGSGVDAFPVLQKCSVARVLPVSTKGPFCPVRGAASDTSMSFLPECSVERHHERADHVSERRALDGRKHDRGRHARVKPHVRQSLEVALINGYERG